GGGGGMSSPRHASSRVVDPPELNSTRRGLSFGVDDESAMSMSMAKRRKQSFSSLAGVLREASEGQEGRSPMPTAPTTAKVPALHRALCSATVCCGALVSSFTVEAVMQYAHAAAKKDREKTMKSPMFGGPLDFSMGFGMPMGGAWDSIVEADDDMDA